MKHWLTALAMCQSMFCAVPCPWHGWDEKARDHMLLLLPVIGLEIGAFWFLTAWVVRALALPTLLQAGCIAAAPWLLTGFMHLDGFMDVTDAVRSWRDAARRREILKDSHVGSFSVIGFGLVLLIQFAASAELQEDLRVLMVIPAVSRCGSILAIRCLKPMSTSQYAERQQSAMGLIVPLAELAIAAVGGFALAGSKYGYVLVVQAIIFLLFLRRAYRSLEGMNGDISGYCITLSELAALSAAAWLL